MDEFDDMLKSLGINESGEAEDSEPSFSIPEFSGDEGGDLSDLDAQLEALLQADQEAEDDFEPMEVGPPISTRSIYDVGGIINDNDGTPNALVYSKAVSDSLKGKGARRSLFARLTVRKLLKTGLFLLLIIVGIGAGLVITALAVAEQRDKVAAMAHFTPISLPVGLPNNANFIPIHETLAVGGQSFTLSRISAGFEGTYFYFDESFDPDQYAILLYDQARRLLVRQQFDIQHDPSLGTVLRFDPILFDTSFLTLFIQDMATGEHGSFFYRIVGPITFGAPAFVNTPVPLLPGGDIFSGLRISHAIFTNTESSIFYSYSGNIQGIGLRQRERPSSTFMHMWDNFSGLTILTEGQAAAVFPEHDAMIGRATFGPLLSLDAEITLNFRDLYYVYPYPRVDVALRDLYRRDQDDPHVIHAGPFRINLEAMDRQGQLMVFVLHGTDETGKRLRTYLDASLYIDIGRGQTVAIPAEQVNVANIGTDIVFNLMPYIPVLHGVHIDRYSLVLHTAEFAVPEINVTLDLTRTLHQPSARRTAAVLAIESAFMSRLAYMSGEMGLGFVVGFSPELLHDEEVMAHYAPRRLNERPLYGATVVAGDFIDNYTFLAVVESTWALGRGDDLEYHRMTHHVVARSQNEIWSIVSDERQTEGAEPRPEHE
jgi:hypothetical protein